MTIFYRMKKSIVELSCQEFEERSDKNLIYSYSRLAGLWRDGPKSLITVEKKDSDSLRFGSLVDCLLTSPEELEDRFVISDFEKPSFTITKILDQIWDLSNKKESDIKLIPASLLLKVLNQENYRPNWGNEARIRDLLKYGSEYFSLLFLCKDKILVNQEDFDHAQGCVDVLKKHPYTKKYFEDNPFNTVREDCYQLKFTSTYNGIKIRGIFDKVIVDHKEKVIIPIDLKTTGKSEESFQDSVVAWNYYIQAEMYLYMLQDAILKDDYFKDFTILPFRFIVINKYKKKPIVWIYSERNREVLREKRIKSWMQLLIEAHWHDSNQLYNYSYETYQANGERIIDLSNIL